jgi:hypothetical protein
LPLPLPLIGMVAIRRHKSTSAEIPSPKSQTPNNSQAPNPKSRANLKEASSSNPDWILVLIPWSLVGVWSLGFGICHLALDLTSFSSLIATCREYS